MKEVLPYGSGNSKTQEVRQMFDSIAHRYDFLNRLLSLGTDVYWRKKMVNALGKRFPRGGRILDVATGTADVAIACLRLHPAEIIGIDISPNMLQKGMEKMTRLKISGITLVCADIMEYSHPKGFDAVTIAFGVRNFEDPARGLKKIYNLLKEDGTLAVLEFSKPTGKAFGNIYSFYFGKILPLAGRIFSGRKEPYRYLPRSVEAFPFGEGFVSLLNEAGFHHTEAVPLTGGVCHLYLAVK